jgi:hypothetical protein
MTPVLGARSSLPLSVTSHSITLLATSTKRRMFLKTNLNAEYTKITMHNKCKSSAFIFLVTLE